MWTYYRVTLLFLTKLCASVPGDPKIVEKWLAARQPKVRAPQSKSIDEIQTEVFATLAEPEEEEPPQLLVFQKHEGRLVLRAATFRAHLKECARNVGKYYVGQLAGESSFSKRFVDTVYHDEREYWLPILRPEGDVVTEADGTFDKPIHVTDQRGRPHNALKTFEYVEPARFSVTVKILTVKPKAVKRKATATEPAVPLTCISVEDLETVLTYGGVHGYGGERGDGEGRYTFTIEPMPAE